MQPTWPLFDRRAVTRMVSVPDAGGSADDGAPTRSAAAAMSPMKSLNRTTNQAYVRTLADATFDVFVGRSANPRPAPVSFESRRAPSGHAQRGSPSPAILPTHYEAVYAPTCVSRGVSAESLMVTEYCRCG